MAITQLSDIGVFPTNVSNYITQQSIETNAFYQSGIIRRNTDPAVQAMLDAGGFEVIFPFFNDLTGSGQIMQEGTNLTVGKVTTGSGKAPVLERAESWGSTDLVADFLGNDPMRLIADRVAAFWDRHYSSALLSVMAGAVGAVTANVLDISSLSGAAAVIDADSFIDAETLLGDRRKKLTAVGMHSKTVAALRKQGLISTIPPQDGVAFAGDYYGSLRIIEDDTMTYDAGTGIYTSYLFAEGSVLFGEGGVKTPQEVERNALINGGQEYLVSRKRFMFVPTGVSFTGSVATTSPPNATNAELATINKWTPKTNQKNIGIVKFIHKIA
ncbi:major capsid protein [Hymenobacter fodinae]|uniref:Coat protein n=1 Tax=Hymenobacter fodinae TaxID=2510796 RepID=A0A4Z0P051_9BACT|nr:major capsid protein [Hymenobacter fodinae]TGE04634.1 hypothetical protein EU556_20835 [Hymenobacter fodinae]